MEFRRTNIELFQYIRDTIINFVLIFNINIYYKVKLKIADISRPKKILREKN